MRTAQLVITAPKKLSDDLAREYGCRTTAGVIEQLMLESQREVILAAPFLTAEQGFFAGESLYAALQNTLRRGVRTRLFLSREGHRALDSSGLVRGTNVPQVFVPSDLERASALGSHAKVVIADGQRAYIGSANLTEPGLSTNFEMGLLVSGSLARDAYCIYQQLVSNGFFVQVTG